MKKGCTMKDIAQKLDLSINAVSLALNGKDGVSEETRQLILQTAGEMGYLQKNPIYKQALISRNICVVIRSIHFRGSRFYSNVLLGAEQEAMRQGYNINISFLTDSGEVPAPIQEGNVCGVLVIGPVSDVFLDRLKSYHLPVVTADHRSRVDFADSVMSDNTNGAYQLTHSLIQHGFERIGFLGDLSYSVSVKQRFYGYQEAISELPAITTYKDLAEYTTLYSALDFSEEIIVGYDTDVLCRVLQDIPTLPQALVCSNDESAFLTMKALSKMGRLVPQDISVTGFDNLEDAAHSSPPLTTVHVRKESLGQASIRQLLWRKENMNSLPRHLLLNVDTVQRDSVGYPPNK